ncbi:hypothetical protein XELAEV_18027159mg [Xenopus laevis]|uniref:Uncharacterized protein n=1 Tax=Xenopus laevis TaxID=8355 RepID=A0A974CXN1_XENLA|nr:hypothetical protein XELAEV_18027159mg [Xenopus laevis]
MVLFPGPFRLPFQTASNYFPCNPPSPEQWRFYILLTILCLFSNFSQPFFRNGFLQTFSSPPFFNSAAASLSSLCSFAPVPTPAVQHLLITVSRYTHAASI